MTETMDGQVSLFDQDTWSGKMSPEHSAATRARTSAPSSKKPRGSQTKLPLFLDLRKASGRPQDASWEMGGALLGVYSMLSFGECPSVAVASHLSQILEEHPPRRYFLSAKACAGILKRAQRRGKELPEVLRKALEQTAAAMPSPSKSAEESPAEEKGY